MSLSPICAVGNLCHTSLAVPCCLPSETCKMCLFHLFALSLLLILTFIFQMSRGKLSSNWFTLHELLFYDICKAFALLNLLLAFVGYNNIASLFLACWEYDQAQKWIFRVFLDTNFSSSHGSPCTSVNSWTFPDHFSPVDCWFLMYLWVMAQQWSCLQLFLLVCQDKMFRNGDRPPISPGGPIFIFFLWFSVGLMLFLIFEATSSV